MCRSIGTVLLCPDCDQHESSSVQEIPCPRRCTYPREQVRYVPSVRCARCQARAARETRDGVRNREHDRQRRTAFVDYPACEQPPSPAEQQGSRPRDVQDWEQRSTRSAWYDGLHGPPAIQPAQGRRFLDSKRFDPPAPSGAASDRETVGNEPSGRGSEHCSQCSGCPECQGGEECSGSDDEGEECSGSDRDGSDCSGSQYGEVPIRLAPS
ncbi:hypothetical protein GMORB2_3173 [Geosmithia morbida]|uniref:Uncharacterized protein n=1 Tax=Geosmithia morbida TaxID=1094350 RepID=A0A9P4YPV4_9HYPO|nr:uncharacterized protein GMORB2_3173 [Geosmithia morbida]KAF4120372.1 hypothetical protein GMORB2_3173 [Geosmithia morbida]